MSTKNVSNQIKAFIFDENAAEVSELAIVLGLIVAGCIVVAITIGVKNEANFSQLNNNLP